MMYIVLGMHKSGTTLISQTLHRSGIHMGDGFEEGVTYDRGNQWEMREAFLINLGLMECREEDYFSLDHYQRVQEELSPSIEEAMRAVVHDCEARYENWGFKEPLTCLTYPLWKKVLPEHRVVGVYRSPVEVMNHYRVSIRQPQLGWRVLRAWQNYNRGLLDALADSGGNGFLLRYEELMNGDGEFRRLEKFLQRPLEDMREPSQYRATPRNGLFLPSDCLLGLTQGRRPSSLLHRLEVARQQMAGDQSIRS